jgi:hypothetical protein
MRKSDWPFAVAIAQAESMQIQKPLPNGFKNDQRIKIFLITARRWDEDTARTR